MLHGSISYFVKVIVGPNDKYWTVSLLLYNMLEKEFINGWFTRWAAAAVIVSIPISILFRHHAEILRGWTYKSCQRLIWFYLGRCTFVRRLLVYIGLWQTLGVCGKLSTFRLCGAGVAHSGSSYFFFGTHCVTTPAS